MNPFKKLRHIVTSEKHQKARNTRNEFTGVHAKYYIRFLKATEN